MANKEEYSSVSATLAVLVPILMVLGLNIYFFAFPVFYESGLYSNEIIKVMLRLQEGGILKNPYITKMVAGALGVLLSMFQVGKKINMEWSVIAGFIAGGLIVYLLPVPWPSLYIISTIIGYTFMVTGAALAVRKGRNHETEEGELNDEDETFLQNEELKENEYSILLKTKYQHKKKLHEGKICVLSPQRASIVYGLPGSGKSFSVINQYIRQMIEKGFTMFVYDYKHPDLSEIAYNEFLLNRDKYVKMYGCEPEFYVINFDDPRLSNRCNPIDASYITDPADTTEIAELIFKNAAKGEKDGGNKFFTDSAKLYSDALIYYLSIYKGGRYCTFPHFIELMACDYRKVFEILKSYPELEVKLSPFANALADNVMEQLQGQIASAQVPLNKFASPALYWVLSANDFQLDINNPKAPKIVCMGNNPKRQSIYGTTVALLTSRMFSLVNQKGRLKSGIILDELPTMFLIGLDQTIATARSNGVCILIGCQDTTQLTRDYGREEADVIKNTVGNVFCGAVNGDTAKEISQMFGQSFKKETSYSEGESDSESISFRNQEVIPASKIQSFTQGVFCGRFVDTHKQKIKKKYFCGEIVADLEHDKKLHENWQPMPVKNTFGEDELIEQIHENEDDYIHEYIKEELRKESQKMGRDMREDDLADTADEHMATLDDEARKAILDTVIKEECKKHIDKIIKDNYDKIKADVKNLVETEYHRVKAENKANETKDESNNAQNKKYMDERMRNLISVQNQIQKEKPAANKNVTSEE